jgi:DNA polymerase-1
MAHYSDGRLLERYKANPRIDAHDETSELIKEYAHLELPRKYVKITGFSIIYGSGTFSLSQQLGVPPTEAKEIKDAYFAALPEVPELMKDCQKIGRSGGHITTWGGRHYVTEPPRLNKKTGRTMTFEYKLLNYLIQGSAGDCTKESIVRWNQDKGNGEFLITVHDENDIQAPKDSSVKDMKKLRDAMESIEFDVKMLSDGFVGDSWFNLEKCK